MKSKHLDIAGQRFGRLLVMARDGKSPNGNARWLCACDCGASTVRASASLRSGVALSCGCLRKERVANANVERLYRHGETVGGKDTHTYRVWRAMVARCTNPKNDAFQWYGGRGISVCDRWMVFDHFLADMGAAPDGMSIDRTNNNGDYEPNNCRWATKLEQANNTRANVFLEWRGETHTMAQWCRKLGLRVGTVHKRLKMGWSVDRALGVSPSIYRDGARRG
ncbi:hypothetical protein [Acidovorax sp. NB1]|uniref:hypothetical protein n=1 Tax=Acidovorax sp. NB1 TaxID=1943571 RepID=UPI0010D8B838|nr:hypothetical protein [Acidovorax sp. NB1]GDY37246.1 hypothetical protein ACINB_31380 [Acidovorax sp. NB1]